MCKFMSALCNHSSMINTTITMWDSSDLLLKRSLVFFTSRSLYIDNSKLFQKNGGLTNSNKFILILEFILYMNLLLFA